MSYGMFVLNLMILSQSAVFEHLRAGLCEINYLSKLRPVKAEYLVLFNSYNKFM